MTRRIIAELMAEGRVRRAYLGIAGAARPLPPKAARLVGRDRGVEVAQVVDGSPATEGGVQRGDVLVSVDETPVQDVADLQRLMTADHIDRVMSLEVLRNWEPVVLHVTPRELSDR